MRKQREIVRRLLLVASLVVVTTGLLINEKDVKFILLTIGAALFMGVFIAKIFKEKFGHKPSREEIERRVFGERNKI
jgi:hypothetical protein